MSSGISSLDSLAPGYKCIPSKRIRLPWMLGQLAELHAGVTSYIYIQATVGCTSARDTEATEQTSRLDGRVVIPIDYGRRENPLTQQRTLSDSWRYLAPSNRIYERKHTELEFLFFQGSFHPSASYCLAPVGSFSRKRRPIYFKSLILQNLLTSNQLIFWRTYQAP